MKVFIGKFYNEEALEDKVGRLVSKSRARFGNNVRVCCVDEPVQKRLQSVGISSDVHSFWRPADVENEANYAKAYELSDQLHSSIDSDDAFKYRGINFLTFEYDLSLYVKMVALAKLCQQMAGQGCEVLIIVLTKPYGTWLPDVRSPSIRTLKFGGTKSLNDFWLYRSVGRLFHLFGRFLSNRFKTIPGRSSKKDRPAPVRETASAAQEQPRALFVVSTPLYARPALAICNRCPENGLTPYVVPYAADIKPIFQDNHNIEYSNRVNLKSAVSVAANGVKVLMLLGRLKRHVASFGDSASRGGESPEFSAAYLCARVLRHELPQLCFTAAYQVVFLENLIESIRPSVMCLMPDGFFLQQLAALVARKHHIPTLACSAALENGNALSYMRHLHADKVAAMGDVIRDVYVKSGLEPGRIVVTGIAHFDRLFNRNRRLDEQVLMARGIAPGKKIIVFATENLSADETVEALNGVIKVMPKLEGVQLVVKVHPSEDPAPYEVAVGQSHNPAIRVVKDVDLYALISRCVLIIVKFSTVALEAMMIDKPVVVINLSGKPVPVPYAEEGAALGVYKYADIGPAMLKALYDEEARARFKAGRARFVRAWAGEPDGQASARIVALMKTMIAGSSQTIS